VKKQFVGLGSYSALTATVHLNCDEEENHEIVSRSVENPKHEYLENKK